MNVTPTINDHAIIQILRHLPNTRFPFVLMSPVLQTKLKLPVVKNKRMKRAHNTKSETKDFPPIKDKLPYRSGEQEATQLPIESVDKLSRQKR
jgi:hypothetical protein